jgi:hypothetical protein
LAEPVSGTMGAKAPSTTEKYRRYSGKIRIFASYFAAT